MSTSVVFTVFVFPGADALRVTMRESSLKVVQGDFVVLPCSFFTSSPLSRLNIIWTMAPSSSPEQPIQVRMKLKINVSLYACVLTQCCGLSFHAGDRL